MFQDLLHFQQLDCTAAVAYSAPDYTLSDPNGNVFCAFTKQTATDKARSAKDGEWATFTGSTTITYDPFGDGVDKNAWADTYTTTSTNPLWKMTGF